MSTMPTVDTQKGETLKLELRRVIRASRERVFAAWTKPEEMRKWLAPGAMNVAEVTTDLRLGGSYRIVMQGSPDDKPELRERLVSTEGVYTEVIPNELVRFTWRPEFRPGEESEITVRLRDVEVGTEIVLTQVRFQTAESCASQTQGWSKCLDKLAGYLGE